MENIELYVAAAVAIAGSVWAIFKAVAKLTPTKKDDAFVEKAGPLVDKLTNGKDSSNP